MLNDPIIESSQNLTFAPYNLAYPLLDQQAQSVGFDPSKCFYVSENRCEQVGLDIRLHDERFGQEF